MKIRLLILLVVLVGVAGYVVVEKPFQNVNTGVAVEDIDPYTPADGDTRFAKTDKVLGEIDLPGEEPPTEPEFGVNLSTDPTDGHNRLYFDIIEQHGYFVETMRMSIYYKPSPLESDDRTFVASHYVNDFIQTNTTLSGCLDIVAAELAAVGGELGSMDHWEAEITSYNRARVEDPPASWPGYKMVPEDRTAVCRP